MGKIVGGVFKTLLGPILGGVLGLGGKKRKAALPPPTRDDALDAITREDEIRRRQGAAADMLTGTTGAGEALGVGKFNVTGN